MNAIAEAPVLQRHRLTVDEYYRMAEVGILAPDARVELIDGEVIDVAPMKSRHASVVAWLNAEFARTAADKASLRCQLPLRLGDRSEPEPDLLLASHRRDHYRQAHPTAKDVLLLVEVADSSARLDREIKLPLYARHGVPEVWIVDLAAGLLRIHRTPVNGTYTEVQTTDAPGVVSPAALPAVTIDLSGILG